MVEKKFKQYSIFVLPVLFAGAASCFGSTVACNATTSASGTHTNTTSGVTIAAAPTAGNAVDDFASLSTAPVVGCASGNVEFENFAATTGSAANTTYISTTANQTLGANAPVIAVFSTIRGADNNGTDANPNDDVNNWNEASAFGAQSLTLNNQYEFTSAVATQYFGVSLNGVGLGAAGAVGGAGAAGTVSGSVFLCLGAAFTGSTSSTCGVGGTLQTVNIAAGVTDVNVKLSLASTTIGVLNDINLNAATHDGGTTFITAYDEEFEVSPEPSTFILLGSALLGLTAFRKRKKA